LFSKVYDELRQLAAVQMGREKPGHTFTATALVQEAYLRLVGDLTLSNRRHFFAAATTAMRRILVEKARHKKRLKHGGQHQRVELDDQIASSATSPEQLLAPDDALAKLAEKDAQAAELVQLHVFAGVSIEVAAEMLGLSRAGAYRHYGFAKAWLRCEMREETL
jgi:RNA polymerase sigma factor (TIGR02999 family)